MTVALRIEVSDAGPRLSELIDLGLTGEAVVITRDGKPIAVLTAYLPDIEPPSGDEEL